MHARRARTPPPRSRTPPRSSTPPAARAARATPTAGSDTAIQAALDTPSSSISDAFLGGNTSQRLSPPSDNVQVFARFRPSAHGKPGASDEIATEYGDDGLSCTLNHDGKEHLFQFSRVFSPWASQDDLYETVGRPIIDGVTRGFNGAIIAYGQTGSGKTHTMVGPAGGADIIGGCFDGPDNGLIPRVLLELQAFAAPTAGAVKLRVSYVEVYQEKVLDLLSPVGKFVCNTMRQDAARGLWLPDVTEMPVLSAAEAMEIMRTGNKHRAKAATEMNSDSSRSHAIFIVTVESHMEAGKLKFAQLYLVDLAGSERLSRATLHGQIPDKDYESKIKTSCTVRPDPAKDKEEMKKRMDETKLINQSLLAMGQVISALSSNAQHVPYRDSKLTRILQNSLGGNARTSIVVTASPLVEHGHETLSTLRFGDRAAMIKNVAKVNIAINTTELKKQLQKSRDEVLDLKGLCSRLERENVLLRSAPMPTFAAPAVAPSTEASDVAAAAMATVGGARMVTHANNNAKLMAQRLLICELLPTLLCPMTGAVMREPVFATDGFTYERAAIEKHLKNAGRMPAMSPVMGRHFPSKVLVPNAVARQLIQRHLPDLPPMEARVSDILRIGINKMELILQCLDGLSLGRVQYTCTSLMAAGAAPHLWEQLLAEEFPDADKDEEARMSYISLRRARVVALNKNLVALAKPSHGLHLFAPTQRIKRAPIEE